MAVGYSIDREREIVLSRGWSEVLGKDVLMHARTLGADNQFVPHYDQLIDLRHVDRSDITANAIWSLAVDSPFRAGAQRAIVVGSDAHFGLARMFEALRYGMGEDILVTRDIDEGIRWLSMNHRRDEMLTTLAEMVDHVPQWNAASGSSLPGI
jgi:hypothetical protein